MNNYFNLLDEYYSDTSINIWKKIIGTHLHYHFGMSLSQNDDINTIGANRIKDFYPYIKPNSCILDIGCGWGGTMTQLQNDLKCNVTGITISSQQYHYCKTNLNVIHCNIEEFTLSKKYDYIIMIEVLSHIKDIHKLLTKLHANTDMLILGYQTCKYNITTNAFENMKLYNIETISDILNKCGWKIVYMKPIMKYAKQSFKIWKSNMEKIPNAIKSKHLIELNNLCSVTLSDWDDFLANYDTYNLVCIKI